MPAIHVLGSSHVSYHHGLPTAICELYDIMEEAFKNRFYLSTAKGVSGGRIANIRLTNEFVSVAEETAKESGYDGQVVCLLLGTNDWARPEMTEINFESQYTKGLTYVDSTLFRNGRVKLSKFTSLKRSLFKRVGST